MIYKDIEWRNYHGVLMPKVAPHVDINLSQDEEKELLKQSRAYFLRYVSDWDSEKNSDFWYVIKDSCKNFNELSANTRNQVRKGLKNTIVKKVTAKEVADKGYETYKEAIKNYSGGIKVLEKDNFKSQILSSSDFDYWAVYAKIDEKLIAYSQNILENNSINYSTIKLHPSYLKLYPSYALFFEMNDYYLNQKDFLYVNDGARSLSHETNIQDFLIQKFKFRKAYCNFHVSYRWDVGLVVKFLYPFRDIIKDSKNLIFKKIALLLKHEEIRRSYIDYNNSIFTNFKI